MHRLLPLAPLLLRLAGAASLCIWAATSAAAAIDPWRAFETPLFRAVQASHGLPSGTVTAIAQDRNGLIWIGTFSGLVRYDGYRMQVFRRDGPDPGQLPELYIRAIAPLADGRLLIGTNAGGSAIFDPATSRFDRLPIGPGGTAHAKIFAFSPARDGGYWIASEGGLDHIDVKKRAVTAVLDGPGAHPTFDPRSFAVLEDRRGNLWVGTNAGLLLRRAGERGFVRLAAQGMAADLLRDKIWALYEDRAGNVWVGSGQTGILYVDAKQHPHLVAGLSGTDGRARKRTVRSFIELDNGTLWAATDGGGIVTYHPASGEVGLITRDPANQASLPGDFTRTLIRDRSGNIWVATEHGAARYDPTSRGVLSILSSPLNSATLSHPTVRILWTDPRGRIWLGLGMGRIDILDQKAGRIRRIRLTGMQAERDVQAFVVGPDGQIWVGSQGIARIDPDTLTVRPSRIPELDSKIILSMAPEGRNLLIGTYDGLFHYSPDGSLKQFVTDPTDPTSLAANQVRLITAMPGGAYWLSTVSGISIMAPGRPGFSTIRNDLRDPRSLPKDYVTAIARDSRGRYWLGTYAGLGLLDRATPPYRFERIGAANGLNNETIFAVLPDGDQLWVSTSDGIALVDGKTRRVRNLGPRDGLRMTDDYSDRAAVRAPDGAMLFGGLGGLTVVRPDLIRAPTDRPLLAITNLLINDVAMPFAQLPANDGELNLPASRRGFRADFALLDYRDTSATRYSHRLLGFDEAWIDVPFDAPPVAAYTNLPSGNYRLQLRAKTGGLFPRTIYSETRVGIAPRWYETLWFRALAAVGLLVAILAIVALSTRLLRRRAAWLEALVEKRTRELRAANDRLAALASTDPLTGIGNRRRFLESATHELELARSKGLRVSLILVDLDRFKAINDNFGHPVGDAVLKRAAEATVRACRPSYGVARFGGEELVVLLPEAGVAEALVAAEAIRGAIAVPGTFEGHMIAITASAGVAEWQGPDETLASLIERADRALYEAKRAGRDRAMLAANPSANVPRIASV